MHHGLFRLPPSCQVYHVLNQTVYPVHFPDHLLAEPAIPVFRQPPFRHLQPRPDSRQRVLGLMRHLRRQLSRVGQLFIHGSLLFHPALVGHVIDGDENALFLRFIVPVQPPGSKFQIPDLSRGIRQSRRLRKHVIPCQHAVHDILEIPPGRIRLLGVIQEGGRRPVPEDHLSFPVCHHDAQRQVFHDILIQILDKGQFPGIVSQTAYHLLEGFRQLPHLIAALRIFGKFPVLLLRQGRCLADPGADLGKLPDGARDIVGNENRRLDNNQQQGYAAKDNIPLPVEDAGHLFHNAGPPEPVQRKEQYRHRQNTDKYEGQQNLVFNGQNLLQPSVTRHPNPPFPPAADSSDFFRSQPAVRQRSR